MIKDPFWYFLDDQLWPFNVQPNISKMEYTSFCSSDCKTEDSFGKLGIGWSKTHFHIFIFSPLEILVTLHLPRGGTMSLGPRRNFRNMGFLFLTPIFHFLSKPKPNEKFVAYSMITRTWTQKTTFDKNPKKMSKENCKKPNLVCQNWVLTKNTH